MSKQTCFIDGYRFQVWQGWTKTWHWQADDTRLNGDRVYGGYDLPDQESAKSDAREWLHKRLGR